MSKDTGGPASPCPASAYEQQGREEGKTLLDWFAGQALPILASDTARPLVEKAVDEYMSAQLFSEWKTRPWVTAHLIAKMSYDIAEAMIAEKRRREAGE